MAASVDRLVGRVAVVTGASRGIGAAVARAFVAQGAAVAIGHEPRPEMATLARSLVDELVGGGGVAVAVPADLAEVDQVDALVATAHDALGPIDILVANAAASARAPWRDIPIEQWDRVHAVNLRATWLLARAAYYDPGQPGQLDYTASKAGIIGLTRGLARELGPDGVRVNAVMPGAIRTEFEVELEPRAEEVAERILPLQALPRRGFAEDLAGTFVYLASGESSFVTGQVITVDGGWVHY